MKLRNKKTGEIGQIGYVATHNGQIIVEDISGEEYPYSVICGYNSLAKLNEEWEDAEDINVPSMPLIDNKEIREIVRAWADVNDAGKLKYNSDENSLDDIYRNTIAFNYGLVGLKDGHSYTIAELCGTPEPLEPTFVDLDERVKGKGGE